jgi:hypothetical protein
MLGTSLQLYRDCLFDSLSGRLRQAVHDFSALPAVAHFALSEKMHVLESKCAGLIVWHPWSLTKCQYIHVGTPLLHLGALGLQVVNKVNIPHKNNSFIIQIFAFDILSPKVHISAFP